jgi:6-phosphogluconolactonase (cycloisomerase 2 family)
MGAGPRSRYDPAVAWIPRGAWPRLAAAVLTLTLVVAGMALGATGSLKSNACVGDETNNPDSCPKAEAGLDDPRGVAVSHDGHSVYVASRDSDDVAIFKRDSHTGALKPKGCIGGTGFNPDNCPVETAGLHGANDVVVSRDGKSVYVGSFDAGSVVAFDRDKSSGALTPAGCYGGPASCTPVTQVAGIGGLAISKDGKSLYVANTTANALSRFKRNTKTGALTYKDCVDDVDTGAFGCDQDTQGLGGIYSVTASEDGESVYAPGYSDGAIVRFNRAGKGSLTPKGCVADPATDPGCAKTAKGIGSPDHIAVSPDGDSVYATGSDAIVRFDRTHKGALDPHGCIGVQGDNPGCSDTAENLGNPAGITVSPDGNSLYANGFGDDAIVIFKRSGSGALDEKGCIGDEGAGTGCAKKSDGLGAPVQQVVSADGKSVYAIAVDDHAVTALKRTP